MHSNIWNLRGSKERLQIMERTEAHKRHLINIITAKCKISTRNSLSFRQAPSSPISLYRRRVINEDNHNLAKKLTSLTKGGLCERNDSSVVLSRNLKTYSSVNRNMRRRQIEEENGRMLSRLIMTSPTIKRQSLMKSQVQISKYKENLNRSKCTSASLRSTTRLLPIGLQTHFPGAQVQNP
jgi:hypothetical protein